VVGLAPDEVVPAQFSFKLYWHRRYDGHSAHRWVRQVFAEVCRALPDSS
jgi:DNA-binding transcriptional LysR family regulator